MKFTTHYFNESESDQKIIVYSGRFQPFHKGHKETYDNLVEKFGKDKVVIGTSNKTELPDSPFNFDEKKEIISKMFGIDEVYQTKLPYTPREILDKYDKGIFILALGNKDDGRIKFADKNYLQPYPKEDEPLEDKSEHGYVYISEPNKFEMSGTDVRAAFQSGDEDKMKEMFNKIYPEYNEETFNLLKEKIKTSE